MKERRFRTIKQLKERRMTAEEWLMETMGTRFREIIGLKERGIQEILASQGGGSVGIP